MKRWKKLLLCFVSLAGVILVGTAIIMACADEPDPYDYYTSFFHADVQGQKDYGSFYFTDYRFTYNDTEPASEADINAREWATYLGAAVKAADVHQVMYGLDSAGRVQLQQDLTQSAPLPDSLMHNSFLQSLRSANHSAALHYYTFALKAEPLANTTYDLWDPAPVDTSTLNTAAREASAKADSTQDSFLKLRYYYQAQRLWHYGHDYEQARKIYQQHIAGIASKSHVKGWALSCKAGEDRWLGDTVLAAYEFSKVFNDYPERRILAYRNYHYINAPFNNVLALANTAQQKANLYAIEGFANSEDGIDDLEQVYSNAPSSAMVGVLLVREINKLESSYLTGALANNGEDAYRYHTSATKQRIQSPPIAKWPLILGIIIVLAGVIILVVLNRKSGVNRSWGLTAGAVILAGALGIGWYVVKRMKTHPVSTTQTVSQGSFFVSLPDSITAKYKARIETLRTFCTKLASEQKYTTPQLGTLVNAYLYFMQNQPDDGLNMLAKLDGQPIDSKLNDQKQIVHLLLAAQRMKVINSVDEQSLLSSLQWLDKKATAGAHYKDDEYPEIASHHNFFKITAYNFYTYVLAPAYLRQGDTARAALALLKSDAEHQYGNVYKEAGNLTNLPDFWFNYLHSSQLNQLLSWRKNTHGDNYLTFMTSELKRTDLNRLQELLGTVYLREHAYREAAAVLSQIKDSKLMSIPYNGEEAYQGDPFVVKVNDYPKAFEGERFTKLKFALKMAALHTRTKTNDADAYYQMANGLYNTSTYGNSWGLISYSWSSYDYGRDLLHYYDEDYVKASLAMQYYLKARQLTSNPELKAKCTFMAAKCKQKEHQAPSFTNYTDYKGYEQRQIKYEAMLKQNKYFNEMQQYKNTAFYKQAITECSYLRDFISKQ